MRISKRLSNCYINCLPQQLQATVKREVIEALKFENVSRETLKKLTAEAMVSKVNDLADCIDIEFF